MGATNSSTKSRDLTRLPELAELVRSTLAQVCSVAPSEISAETTLLELNADSLTIVCLLSVVESAHKLEFAPDDLVPLLEAEDVGELSSRIAALLAQSEGSISSADSVAKTHLFQKSGNDEG